ncbi:MAG: c-type cytochrome [Proteobacteria bacterium]|nr:c-type cytochrome [Pseudomonadota bacterium]MDA1332386.1 c-type cytochrome [Pseudomonadota bacterium]
MKKVVVSCLVAFGLSFVSQVQANDAEALAKSKNCLSCHAIDKKLVGPAYKDVAKGKDPKGGVITLERLVKSIKTGSMGKWGPIPMPPNAVTDEEAKRLAKWILSL